MRLLWNSDSAGKRNDVIKAAIIKKETFTYMQKINNKENIQIVRFVFAMYHLDISENVPVKNATM